MSTHSQTAAASRPSWLRSAWLHPFNDRTALNELLQRVLPRAALGEIRARVAGVIEETADTRSFELHTNRHWPSFRAGQHTLVTIDVRGRKLQRCFSLSSAPTRPRRLAITVKRHSQSGATAWMHTHLRVGSIVTLSPPFGAFRMPEPMPKRVLMLSAGSGITPLMAMLRELYAQRCAGDIVLLHSCRQPADWIFSKELQAMASDWPSLQLKLHCTHNHDRLDADQLRALVPDFAERHSLLCGPPQFAEWVHSLYQQHHATALLHSETFGLPRALSGAAASAGGAVHCAISEHSFTAVAGQPLLLAAEAAGLTPRYGCRIGICRTCLCRKQSGTVENLLTGEISAEPGQLIQLCISTARSPLTLDL